MQTKPLLYGLIGFFIGGLLVSVAATTMSPPNNQTRTDLPVPSSKHMSDERLSETSGDDFDAAFIREMISHHESAVSMAKLSEKRAKHNEIKTLSNAIITTQQKEIRQLQQWQKDWGYSDSVHGVDHNISH